MTAPSQQVTGRPALGEPRLGIPAPSPALIARPRLTALLDAARPIVVVAALPGYGATSALAQWARASAADVGWLSAGAVDLRHPATWAALAGAVEDATGHVLDPPADRDVLDHLLAHAGDSGGGGVLVIDGLRTVHDGERRHRFAGVVEGLSRRLRVVLAGPAELPLPLATWRARGLVTDIDERELAFDEAEALAVARSIAPAALGDADVIALNRRVEGWPMALVLALTAIRDAPNPERVRAIFTEPGQLLHDHVMAEVVGGLSRHEREQTLALAVAEDLDGESSRLLAGDAAPAAVDRLRAARLLVAVPDRPALLRFNPVVRAVLDRRLSWVDPVRHSELHRRMAELCHGRGELNEAHRHLLAAGQGDATTRLVMVPTVELSDAADRPGLVAMLGRLPRPQSVDDAGLAFDIALAWVFAGSARQAWVWCDRAEALMDTRDEGMLPRLHATRCVLGVLTGDLESAAAHRDAYEALEGRAGLKPPVEGVLDSAAIRLALAAGDLDRARAWLDRARSTVSNPVFDLIVGALQAWADMLGGQLRGPLARVERINADFAARGLQPHHGHFESLVVEGWAQLGAGNLERADRCAADAMLHAELLGFDWNRVRAGALDAHVRLLRDGPAAGLAAARESRLGLDHPVSPLLMEPIDVVEVRALLGHGQHDTLATAIATMADTPARALVAAAAALAAGHAEDVAAILDGCSGWRVPDRFGAQCLLAAAGAEPDTRLLFATVDEAASLGWVSPFLGHGRQVDTMLRRLPLRRVHPALAARLLADHDVAPRLFEPLTARERTVLELLPSHLSYSEIGRRLNVSVNTVKSNMKSIYRKLGVATRSTAVEAAAAHGLL